jgi:siroheme synthase (precorrin-2 oxidase/ferrochelatase)
LLTIQNVKDNAMTQIILNDVEQKLSKMTVDELTELERKIKKIMTKKDKRKKANEWEKDFLSISTWKHLDNSSEVHISNWKIKTY